MIEQHGLLVDEEGQIRPLHAPGLVVELVLDDVAGPAVGHGHVGAGANGQPHIGLGSVGSEARVDDHGLHALHAQVVHRTSARGHMALRRIGAPHDQTGRHGALVVDLAHRGVGDRGVVAAVQHGLGAHARQVALGAARLEEVAAAERLQETVQAEELRVSTAARGDNELHRILLVDLREVVGDGVDSLLPRDALPLVGTALAHALHGILHAVGIVQSLHSRQALGADAPLRHGVDGVALDLDHAAVLHVHEHAAVGNAGAAGRVDDFHRLLFRRFLGARGGQVGLLHVGAPRNRTGSGGRTGHGEEIATGQRCIAHRPFPPLSSLESFADRER